MSLRKLQALGWTKGKVDVQNDAQFQELVRFLETSHLRLYASSQRQFFSDANYAKFIDEVAKYFAELRCPYNVKEDPREAVAEWLVDTAAAKAYEEEGAGVVDASFTSRLAAKQSEAAKDLEWLTSDIDVNSEQFKKAVEALGKALGLSPHGDHATTLRAADKYIAYVVQSGARQRHIAYADEQPKSFSLDRFDLGVRSTGDPNVDSAVRALRLIHVDRLRQLQSDINELIVKVQKITANPKADLKLGKVGR